MKNPTPEQAAKAFGWKLMPSPRKNSTGRRPKVWKRGKDWGYPLIMAGADYTDNPAAIMKEIRRRGLQFEVHDSNLGKDTCYAQVAKVGYWDDTRCSTQYADTPAMALTLALLAYLKQAKKR